MILILLLLRSYVMYHQDSTIFSLSQDVQKTFMKTFARFISVANWPHGQMPSLALVLARARKRNEPREVHPLHSRMAIVREGLCSCLSEYLTMFPLVFLEVLDSSWILCLSCCRQSQATTPKTCHHKVRQSQD